MDENVKDVQEAEPSGTEQQGEKTFTQEEVNRIVQKRVAQMKQDSETADTYRRERDEARSELEQYKNDAFLKEKGVSEQYRGYVSFEAAKLVDGTTDFKQAVEKFLQMHPTFAGKGFRAVSTGKADGGTGTSASGDAAIRNAMGLKG